MKVKLDGNRAVPVHDDINAPYVKKIDKIVEFIDSVNKFHIIRDIYKGASYDGIFNTMVISSIQGTCDCGFTFKVPFYTLTFFCPVCFKALEIDNKELEDRIIMTIRIAALKRNFLG